MKKIAITLACVLIASAAYAERKVDPGASLILGGLLDCSAAVEMTCGETAVGNLVVPAAGNVDVYGCSGLTYESSPEAVYEICVAADGQLTVDMSYTHDSSLNDLDLVLLGSCNEGDCLDMSTQTSGLETVTSAVTAGTYYVVVDGWGGRADGSGHSVAVTCDAPCTPTAVDAASWGEVKALYNK